ncbi:unnamed protein product [Nesidiocoris tenuis]|uniref:Reverse transcriptase domain-containing protein n=1 Tax=Nesidiocoris tenuis TaxID=355587 RepID=A0A6H5H9W7_9HEMI|nr:unnamed protein product [Nesidiocoris tenuis]
MAQPRFDRLGNHEVLQSARERQWSTRFLIWLKVYQKNLKDSLPLGSGAPDVDDWVVCILNSIRSSVPVPRKSLNRKQAWYDWDCEAARAKSMNLLKLYRCTSSADVRLSYVNANKEYKALLLRKKTSFFNNLASRFKAVKDARELWALIKIFKKPSPRLQASFAPEEWVDHFETLLGPTGEVVGEALVLEPLFSVPLLDDSFTMGELTAVLGSAKDHKAPGCDGIPYEFYKNAPLEFQEALLSLFNHILHSGDVPQTFGEAIIYPLYKKGDPACLSNYRGLSFINCIGKILSCLLSNRLNKFVQQEDVLSEFQSGFRKGYSTVDSIFVLTGLAKLRMNCRRGKLYAFFVDLRAAFDTVDRNLLFSKLFGYKISPKFISILQGLYAKARSSVWTKEGCTDSFEVFCGVRQGCPLSPLLFSLFVNDLTEKLVCGVGLGDCVIRVLLYADDLVILAKEPGQLQDNIKALEE